MLIAIILFAPLFGALFAGFFALSNKNIIAAIIPIITLCISLLCVITIAPSIVNGNIETLNICSFIAVGSFYSSFGFMIDGITMVMIFCSAYCVYFCVCLLYWLYGK